jgi:hypothetical protein
MITRRLLPSLALLVGVLAACMNERVDAASLAHGITEVVSHREEREVALASIVTSDWTQVGVFGPYTRLEALKRCIGGRSGSRLTRGIDSRDDVTLLVFTFPDGSHESVAVARAIAIFGPEASGNLYTKPQARFSVGRTPTGRRGYLMPASGISKRCS